MVCFKVHSNRPLKAGTLMVTSSGTPQEVVLLPTAGGDGSEVRGVLKVKEAGKLSISVADAAQPQLEQMRSVPILQVRETAVARQQTSTARKAEMTRRLFGLALCLR